MPEIKIEDMIGQIVENQNGVISRETEEEYSKKLGKKVRFIIPGYMYTQEYSPMRINIKLNKECEIIGFNYG